MFIRKMMFTNYLKRIFINLFTKEYSNLKLFLQLLFPIQFLWKKCFLELPFTKLSRNPKFILFYFKKNITF